PDADGGYLCSGCRRSQQRFHRAKVLAETARARRVGLTIEAKAPEFEAAGPARAVAYRHGEARAAECRVHKVRIGTVGPTARQAELAYKGVTGTALKVYHYDCSVVARFGQTYLLCIFNNLRTQKSFRHLLAPFH